MVHFTCIKYNYDEWLHNSYYKCMQSCHDPENNVSTLLLKKNSHLKHSIRENVIFFLISEIKIFFCSVDFFFFFLVKYLEMKYGKLDPYSWTVKVFRHWIGGWGPFFFRQWSLSCLAWLSNFNSKLCCVMLCSIFFSCVGLVCLVLTVLDCSLGFL